MPSLFNVSSLALALTLVGCASRAPQPRTLANTPPAPAVSPVVQPLLPINASGETIRYVSTSSGTIEIGLVERGPRVEVVRLAGTHRSTLFVPPLAIAGVPAALTDFDYMIDPTANVDGDTAEQFRLVASTSDNQRFTYHATFLFTWNAARNAFDIAAPTVDKQDRTICLPCLSDAR